MELNDIQRERIRNGAALLDEKCPVWFSRIDLTSMDVNSFSNCILCHSFGTFNRGLEDLGFFKDESPYKALMAASECGFYPYAGESVGDDSQEAHEFSVELAKAKNAYWAELIRRRLEGVK